MEYVAGILTALAGLIGVLVAGYMKLREILKTVNGVSDKRAEDAKSAGHAQGKLDAIQEVGEAADKRAEEAKKAGHAQGKLEGMKEATAPAKRRVLIVDDDPVIIELFSLLLTHAGYEIGTAASGIAALQKVQAFKPELVLLDMLMPGMSGGEVLKWIKQLTDAPVFIVSGAQPVMRDIEIASGLLTKPVEPERLLLAVGAIFKDRRPLDEVLKPK